MPYEVRNGTRMWTTTELWFRCCGYEAGRAVEEEVVVAHRVIAVTSVRARVEDVRCRWCDHEVRGSTRRTRPD